MSTQPVVGWVPDDAEFGARLALVRQRMGWGNVKEAALACGVPVESWRNWERDGRMPRDYVSVCQKIAARTGVDLPWLAGLPRLDSNQQPAPEPPCQGLTVAQNEQVRDAVLKAVGPDILARVADCAG